MMTPAYYLVASPAERRAFWRTNLLAAKALMECIDASKVNLDRWRKEPSSDVNYAKDEPNCGTIACFGGWCSWEPHFRALGLRPNTWGEPQIEGSDLWAGDAAGYLFGNERMFYSGALNERYPDVAVNVDEDEGYAEDWERTFGPAKVSDHQIVLGRISKALAALGDQP